MYEIMDPQMANIADYDCFSQVVFRNFEDYKKIKDDPWYKEHLVGDHENFADTKRSKYVLNPMPSRPIPSGEGQSAGWNDNQDKGNEG
jgi:hypothetical protein